jgi:glycosyltransferase involved in cell wall biosynthesis
LKILCFIDSLGSGGAQRQLVNLAIGFKEKGHDVSFLVYHHEPFYLKDIERYHIPYHCILDDNYLKRLFKLRSFIRKGNYDSILSFLEAANFIATLSGFPFRRWKLIVGERSANPNILSSKKLRFYRWFHFFTDYVVANSQVNIEMVKKINPFLSSKKYKVIYNIVESSLWRPSRSYIPFKDGKINIVVAASHQYHKNAKGLINAINNLPLETKNKIKIDWYGDERQDTSLKENLILLRESNLESILTFHKASKNLIEKMQLADAVGLFSFYEGLPNVICEAMSVGKPVLTSKVSDLPVILKGTRNILFDPTKIDEICSALKEISSYNIEELQNIGLKNREIALSIFNNENVINNYLKLLL